MTRTHKENSKLRLLAFLFIFRGAFALFVEAADQLLDGADQRLAEFGQCRVAGFDRNQHEIQAPGKLMAAEPERLPHQPLDPVPQDGVSMFSGNAEADAQLPIGVRGGKHREMPAPCGAAQRVDPREIGSPAETLLFAKA